MADAAAPTTDTAATTTAATTAANTTKAADTAAAATTTAAITDVAKTSVAAATTDTAKTDTTKTVDATKDAKADPAAGPFDPKAFKPSEGVKIDPASLDAFAGVINNDKLSAQDRGNELIKLHNAELKKVGEANTKSWSEMQQKWVGEIKADTTLGGDKLSTTVATIAKVIDSLGVENAKSFREALDVTGAGNNPAIVRALHAFAAKLTEGGHVTGSPPSSKPDTKALFFPNSPEMKGTG